MQLTMFPTPAKSEKPIKPIHHLPNIATMENLQRDKKRDARIMFDFLKDYTSGKQAIRKTTK